MFAVTAFTSPLSGHVVPYSTRFSFNDGDYLKLNELNEPCKICMIYLTYPQPLGGFLLDNQ
jgi:hypothetical protein